MLSKYEPHFASLSEEEASYTTRAVVGRHPSVLQHGTEEPTSLFELCTRSGLSQADVVMSMSRDPSATAVVCLEKLVGRPLRREKPKPQRAARRSGAPKGAAVRRSDPRKIVHVEPNPKKPGTKSYDRFALYQVGMTVDEFVTAGGTTADVKWDLERGFIKLEDK